LVEQWRALSPISAVKNGRMHFVTDGYLTVPSQRVTLTAETLLEMIHPELGKGE
jgi:ABC-type Fe3+-hydroxamate transport system substrate-binding protein